MDKRLFDFVNENIKKGVNPSELKSHLISNGWSEGEVNSAIDSASGKRSKKNIAFAFVGIIIIGILALVLILMAKNNSPPPADLPINNNAQLGNTNAVDNCISKDYSMEKDECYKSLIEKSNLDCETIEDNIEFTYCSRAYEELMIEGLDETEEIST